MRILICLALFVASGCVNDDYPEVRPKLVDYKRNRFLNHELVDKKNVKFQSGAWETGLEKLNGHYCLSAEEIGNLNSWARRRYQAYEEEALY